ncbi:MAG TPA: hypothetical protein VK550_24715 [Polyangiaceae bacterium]|nr:hypothetical protein [Polyangiaceae bacterium]
MRCFRLALAMSLVGASACSLLLDTDALQKAGTAGASGAAGSSGAGAGGGTGDLDAGRDAGAACSTDVDCQPFETVEGCTRYECKDKICAPPRAHTGLGVVSVAGDAETADQAEDIGYPSLVADGTDLVLAFWKRNGTTSNIVIRKYDERPEISPTSADLSAISSNRFDSVSSSPGMIIRGIPRRIRLLAAAKPTGAAVTGMYQLDIDLANLRVSPMQPTKMDLGVTGFDVSPRGPAPRLLPSGLGEPVGMWIQQGKLFYFDANSTGDVYSAKRVIGFSPLAATAGVHAALETTDLGSTDDQGETELWTRNSNVLTTLIGDIPSARRRGVATTATAEGTVPINFVIWSFERAGAASLLYAVSSCDGMQCPAVGAPAGTGGTLAATSPAAASARVTGATADRDMAAVFQVTASDPTRPSIVTTALLGGITRVTTTQDGGPALAATAMNPATFFVTLTNAPAVNVGPTSVAITPGGLMMVAWVERGATQALLKTRRFQVKTCP